MSRRAVPVPIISAHISLEAELASLVSKMPEVERSAIELACLWHVCDLHLSSRCSPQMAHLRLLQGRCVLAHAAAAGVARLDVVTAVEALGRAQTTYSYLHSLPD